MFSTLRFGSKRFHFTIRSSAHYQSSSSRKPKSRSMASPITYAVEVDKDLDDAALWAVIDSAAASHSATKPRKQLAIKYPNHHKTPIVSHPSPPQKFPSSRIVHYQAESESVSRVLTEGEVVQDCPWNRPQKMARRCGSEMSESSPMALVRNVQQRTPTAAPVFASPEAYLSPQIGRFDVKEFSNNSDCSPRSYLKHEERREESMTHSLSGRFPSVSLFKEYQNAAMAILEKTDFTMISGSPFIKKSGWRKISFYFNLSYEIKDKTIEFDENRNVQRAEFVVRAHMQGGRFSDGWGSCERREKRFLKPNHDIPSTAETRAKNKACQDLLGIGEYRPGAGQLQRQT